MKLGEALIQEGLITQEQLRSALDRQIVMGGRIDTNIVELKFLTDEKLTAFLGKFLRLPVMPHNIINSIPEEVINIVNKETVEKYMILPFRLDRQRLHTAMLNPWNIKNIDNLRFLTGYEIIPYVVTELRLLYALDKYYGIKRDTRYISIDENFEANSPVETSVSMEKRIIRRGGDETAKSAGPERPRPAPERILGKEGSPGLVEAVLLNAIYTAKLLYRQQGITAPDSAIEAEVLKNWKLLAGKLESRGPDSSQ